MSNLRNLNLIKNGSTSLVKILIQFCKEIDCLGMFHWQFQILWKLRASGLKTLETLETLLGPKPTSIWLRTCQHLTLQLFLLALSSFVLFTFFIWTYLTTQLLGNGYLEHIIVSWMLLFHCKFDGQNNTM